MSPRNGDICNYPQQLILIDVWIPQGFSSSLLLMLWPSRWSSPASGPWTIGVTSGGLGMVGLGDTPVSMSYSIHSSSTTTSESDWWRLSSSVIEASLVISPLDVGAGVLRLDSRFSHSSLTTWFYQHSKEWDLPIASLKAVCGSSDWVTSMLPAHHPRGHRVGSGNLWSSKWDESWGEPSPWYWEGIPSNLTEWTCCRTYSDVLALQQLDLLVPGPVHLGCGSTITYLHQWVWPWQFSSYLFLLHPYCEWLYHLKEGCTDKGNMLSDSIVWDLCPTVWVHPAP